MKLPIWKPHGKLFTTTQEQLLAAKEASGCDEAHQKRRMGAGFYLWEKALSGEPLDLYQVNHVEWGLTPEFEMPTSATNTGAMKA